MTDDNNDWAFATRAQCASASSARTRASYSEPIFTTSSCRFQERRRGRGALCRPGARQHLLTLHQSDGARGSKERLAALEGGEPCVAFASGMVAILSTCLALLKSGDHIVSSRNIFGTTVLQFNNYLGKFGVATSYVPQTDYAAWEKAIRPNTKLLFLETPSNPQWRLPDIARLPLLSAHSKGCLLVVDNVFCTPALQRLLELGADIVVHSATKYLDGQDSCVGGAVVGNNKELVGGKEVYGFFVPAGLPRVRSTPGCSSSV